MLVWLVHKTFRTNTPHRRLFLVLANGLKGRPARAEISAQENNVSDVLGNFKKFTSKKIVASILANPVESRKEWMIKIFNEAGELNSRNSSYQFWKQDNEPKVIYTPEFVP